MGISCLAVWRSLAPCENANALHVHRDERWPYGMAMCITSHIGVVASIRHMCQRRRRDVSCSSSRMYTIDSIKSENHSSKSCTRQNHQHPLIKPTLHHHNSLIEESTIKSSSITHHRHNVIINPTSHHQKF